MNDARSRWAAEYSAARLVRRFHDATRDLRGGDLLSLALDLSAPLFDAAWREARGPFFVLTARERLAYRRRFGRSVGLPT